MFVLLQVAQNKKVIKMFVSDSTNFGISKKALLIFASYTFKAEFRNHFESIFSEVSV